MKKRMNDSQPMPERKNPSGAAESGSIVGGSSVLVILAVLCMTVFALLSIATVKADIRLSEKQVSAIEDYYEADCRAEEIIGQLREGKVPEGVTQNGDVYSFSCQISSKRVLETDVRITGDNFEIIRRQTVAYVSEFD